MVSFRMQRVKRHTMTDITAKDCFENANIIHFVMGTDVLCLYPAFGAKLLDVI